MPRYRRVAVKSLTMHIFDVAAVGVMRCICDGEDLGTRISVKK